MIAIVLSVVAAASLANGAVSGRAAMQGVHIVALIGVALVVGFVGVTLVDLALNPANLFNVPPDALPWIVALGLVQFAIGRTAAYTSLGSIGPSRTSLFMSSSVPFAAFFAVAFIGESLTPLVAAGTVGVIIGLLLASGDSITQGWRADRRYLIGCLTGLTAGAASGGGSILAKQAVGAYDSPLTITALGTLAAMCIMIPAVGFIASRNPAIREFDWKSMGFVGISGLSTSGYIIAQLFAVQRADVVTVAPILATFPLWTLLLSHIFISRLERITWRLTIGAVVAVAGVIAVALGGNL